MLFIGLFGLCFGVFLHYKLGDMDDLLLQLFTIVFPVLLIAVAVLALSNYYSRIKGKKVGDFLEILNDRIVIPNTDSIFIPFLPKTNEVAISNIVSIEIDVIKLAGVPILKILDGTKRHLVITEKNLGVENFKLVVEQLRIRLGDDVWLDRG